MVTAAHDSCNDSLWCMLDETMLGETMALS